jgi:hypothetical protein
MCKTAAQGPVQEVRLRRPGTGDQVLEARYCTVQEVGHRRPDTGDQVLEANYTVVQ